MAHTQYPGSINSKDSELTTVCLIADNHVHVDELANFPAAPNEATLYENAEDETAETVTYTGKSAPSGAGELTGLTRSFEGTAKEWPVGTKIARLITNYDFHALQEDIVLKADIASPTFTGTPAAPTAAYNDDTTQIATTAFVQLNSLHPYSAIVLRGNALAASLPKTFVVSSVAGDTVTVSTSDVGQLWYSDAYNVLYLCIYNSTRSTYAWMKAMPAANKMQFTVAGDVSGWQATDALTTDLYGVFTCAIGHDMMIYDVSPLVTAHPSMLGIFVELAVLATTAPTASSIFYAYSFRTNNANHYGLVRTNPTPANMYIPGSGFLWKPESGTWVIAIRMSGTSAAGISQVLTIGATIGDC